LAFERRDRWSPWQRREQPVDGRRDELRHLMTNTAITGTTYDIDGDQRLID